MADVALAKRIDWRAAPRRRRFPLVSEPSIRVIAAVVARGDRLLVCQRPPHKRHGGLWEFPGGKCEPGETDLDAARRELREELGVEVLDVAAEELAIRDPGSPFLIAFVPVTIVGEPACHEHTALVWDTLERVAALPLAPSDRRYVEHRLATSVPCGRPEAAAIEAAPGG